MFLLLTVPAAAGRGRAAGPGYPKFFDANMPFQPRDLAGIWTPNGNGFGGGGRCRDCGDRGFSMEFPAFTAAGEAATSICSSGHVAGLFGGSWLTPGLLNDEAMQTYIASVAHFRQAAAAGGVEAWLQNHPLMVPFQDWLTRLSSRGRNDTNPFIVGRGEYQRFLDVIEGCSRIALARRGL